MFQRIVRLLTLVGIFGVAAGVPGEARATDRKMYPGAFCQQGGTSQSLWYYHGRVINTSTSRRVADCPIVSDSPYGVYKGKVEVFVVDRHYSEDFSCTLHRYDQYASTPQYVWSNRRSAGSSESVQILTFDFAKAPINARTWAPTLIGCEIPGAYSGNRSDLISYLVHEYENGSYDSAY